MDKLTDFESFLKENIIIINYPSGAFGSFLSQIIQLADNVHKTEGCVGTFNAQGATHNFYQPVFNNLHDYTDLKKWAKLSVNDRIAFLHTNLNYQYDNDHKYVIKICSPESSNSLAEVFNVCNIVNIYVEPADTDLLSKMILHKILIPQGVEYIVSVAKQVCENLNDKKLYEIADQKNFQIALAKKCADYFISTMNQQNFYDIAFSDFLVEEKFKDKIDKIITKLNLIVSSTEIDSLYTSFINANQKYIT